MKLSCNKKGQSATEYIIILAVVLVIAVIVLSILGKIPGIGGGNSEKSNSLQLMSYSIGVSSFSVSTSETKLTLVNNKDYPVQVLNLTINGVICDSQEVSFTMGRSGSKSIICSNVYGVEFGERFEFDMHIDWKRVNAAATFIQEDMKLFGVVGRNVANYCFVNSDCAVGDSCVYGQCMSDVLAFYTFEDDDDSTWVRGKIGNALSFDGVDDYVSLADLNLLTSGTSDIISTSFWVNTNQSDEGDGLIHFDDYVGVYLCSDGSFSFQSDGDNAGNCPSGTYLSDDSWHHVSATYVESERYLGYLDGELVFNVTTSDTQGDHSNSAQIGFRVSGDSDDYFNGTMDDVAIYNRSLSAVEVQKIYDRGNLGLSNNIETGRVAYYPLDESKGLIAEDKVNGNNGTLVNYVDTAYDKANNYDGSYTNNAFVNYSVSNSYLGINGDNGRVIIPDADVLDFQTGNFTMAAWINNKLTSDSTSGRGIVTKGGNSAAENEPYKLYKSSSGNLVFQIQNTSSSGPTVLVNSGVNLHSIPNQWVHVIVTYVYVDEIRIYVNGTLKNIADASSYVPYAGTSDLLIGSLKAAASDRVWNGSIDDVVIFNNTLTTDEITFLYENGPFS